MRGPRVFADYLQRHALFVSELGPQVLFLHQTRVSDTGLTRFTSPFCTLLSTPLVCLRQSLFRRITPSLCRL